MRRTLILITLGVLLARPALILATPLWLAYGIVGIIAFTLVRRAAGCLVALCSVVALALLIGAGHWPVALALFIGAFTGARMRRP